MRRLPTGMYQPGSSEVHAVSSVVKLLCLIIIIAAIIETRSPLGYCILAAVITAIVYLAALPAATALSAVGRFVWFFVVILFMNTCFYAPEQPWISVWIFKPSYAGLMQGINVVVRLIFVLTVSNVLTVTTSPLELTRAIETLLMPLRFLAIPTAQIAMIISVAIQFIPTLLNETEMIRMAQTARGAQFDSRRLHEKAAAVIPLVIPIFLSAFKRADELALAMEARGYRTNAKGGRVKMGRPALRDCAALLICLALLGLEVVVVNAKT